MEESKLDKVIKGLTQCTSFGEIGQTEVECNDCPYCEGYKTGLCWVQMNRDALELLKEQQEKIKISQLALDIAMKKGIVVKT